MKKGLLIGLILIVWLPSIGEAQDRGQGRSPQAERPLKKEKGKVEQSLAITKVSFKPKRYVPDLKAPAVLSFTVTQPADVTVKLFDETGGEVQSHSFVAEAAGKQQFFWNGSDSEGDVVEPGNYLYQIEAIGSNDTQVVYNPAETTAGRTVRAEKFRYNQKTKAIEYILPKTCMVRIRAGLQEGAFMKNILDWEAQKAGRHSVPWDGLDDTGALDLSQHPELNLNLTCYTLPSNIVMVQDKPKPGPRVRRPQGRRRARVGEGKHRTKHDKVWSRKGKYLHYHRCGPKCREPEFKISFPKHAQKDENNQYVLNGEVPIRIEVDPQDVAYMVDKRFEIVLYVDGVYLFEVEEGSTPFTCHWDTRGFRKGPHVLTVNMISYDDHIGVAGKKIVIGDE